MRKTRYFDGDTFERGGRTFRVNMPYDDCGLTPWEDDCGAGIVSDGTRRDKEPGERELCSDRGSRRFYDFAETTKKAKRDAWGLGEEHKAALARKLGREPTRKQIIAEAVERDFDRIRRWCNDQWQYVGVVVTALDDEDEDVESQSLWGIESDCEDYIAEVTHEMADELNAQLDSEFAAVVAASRPDLAEGAAL